jgi:cytochrome c oxidase subunit II
MSRPIYIRLGRLTPLALTGCSSDQSVFAPFGESAERIAALGSVMFIGGALIFLLVLALVVYAAAASPERRKWLTDKRAVIYGGIAFPVVVLSALLIYELSASEAITGTEERSTLRIEVVGEQWWWRVHYLDEAGKPFLITANEIHIPVGQPVEFLLRTADVIHSFWVPNLAGKLDMIPGRVNKLRVRAEAPGVFRGQCAEYCGGAHAHMSLYVVATTEEEFEDWLTMRRQPALEPTTPGLKRGRDLFLSHGCGACHTIRGTLANGIIGPDLTHVGSRLTIGAGMFPNHVGTLAGWIAGAQTLKPGIRMPSFNVFSGEELRALAAYLESLDGEAAPP